MEVFVCKELSEVPHYLECSTRSCQTLPPKPPFHPRSLCIAHHTATRWKRSPLTLRPQITALEHGLWSQEFVSWQDLLLGFHTTGQIQIDLRHWKSCMWKMVKTHNWSSKCYMPLCSNQGFFTSGTGNGSHNSKQHCRAKTRSRVFFPASLPSDFHPTPICNGEEGTEDWKQARTLLTHANVGKLMRFLNYLNSQKEITQIRSIWIIMRWHFLLMGGHSWSMRSCSQSSCLDDHINLINFCYINIVPVIALSIINSDAIRTESKTVSASTPSALQSCWHFKSGFNQMLIRREKVQAGEAANNPERLRISQRLIILQHGKHIPWGGWQSVSISSFNKAHCNCLNIYFSNWKYVKHFAICDFTSSLLLVCTKQLKVKKWPGQNEFVWAFFHAITFLYY